MATEKNEKLPGYEELHRQVQSGSVGNVYIFQGEETYLMQQAVAELQALLVPPGFEEFNYHRLSGKGLTVQEVTEAVEAMPMMAEHTFVTVTDMDIFKLDEPQRTALTALLGDFPEYCTLVFLYRQIPYKKDARLKKLASALAEHAQEIEFAQQGQQKLFRWVRRRFAAMDKEIDDNAVEHLLFTCGSLMDGLVPEIAKIGAYAKGKRITVADIDAVADPVLDAEVFQMTDAVAAGKYDRAAELLADAGGTHPDTGGAGQNAAAAVHGAAGHRRRQGSGMAEGSVAHEVRLSGAEAAGFGAERAAGLVPRGGEALSGAGSPDEK